MKQFNRIATLIMLCATSAGGVSQFGGKSKMTQETVSAAIMSVPATVAALVGLWNTQKISNLHIAVNSRLSELIESTRRGAFAEGQKTMSAPGEKE